MSLIQLTKFWSDADMKIRVVSDARGRVVLALPVSEREPRSLESQMTPGHTIEIRALEDGNKQADAEGAKEESVDCPS